MLTASDIPATLDPPVAAQVAGLRYVDDNTPGISRRGRPGKFSYYDPAGRRIRDPETIARIRALVIPPAWTDVWICPIENGHLQATGRDARRRKQYRYHPRWREARDETKYHKMIGFARALPTIHRRVKRDLARRGMPREKVLAAVVRLLETTLIRVGNDEYARQNDSFGLTTMRNDHARVRRGTIRFEFRGKSGKEHEIDLEDPALARIVRACQDLPGQELFGYVDEAGVVRDVNSSDVNDYVREIAGDAFTAKDFRTWAGTVLAARALAECKKFHSQAAARRNIVQAVERVARALGNTKAVCRKCYIHPEVINAYLDGRLPRTLKQTATRRACKSLANVSSDETAVLKLLERQFDQPAGGRTQLKRARKATTMHPKRKTGWAALRARESPDR